MHTRHSCTPRPVRIEFFAKVDVEQTAGEEATLSYWIVAVSFYFEHQCRVWCGYPAEV